MVDVIIGVAAKHNVQIELNLSRRNPKNIGTEQNTILMCTWCRFP